ncbi:hypothetical protein [Armatimonas rosea]|uniref:Uncharacterized protein n=1 Tax=Armatimonas rosea TaxID=685828 RepID=A0A7W9W9T2_ARMRO|nr:hypothetical protein [Armatimonas rosea]MBB6052877.1 hypothetical protein [Armatimonas rosea]
MKTIATTFDENKARAIVAACQQRIEVEPDDTANRLQLAWCLLTWAFYQSGQESGASPRKTASLKKCRDPHDVTAQGSQVMLFHGLRQALIVAELSTNPNEHLEVSNLINLATLFGNTNIVEKSYRENDLILSEIVWDMRHNLDKV